MDTAVTFSVVVPTSGRPTLSKALQSVASQLAPGDELLVLCNRDLDDGTKARTALMRRATSSHLLFLDDDDDAYLPGALLTFRNWAQDNPGLIGIFRQRLVDGTLLWRSPDFRIGNVGSLMFVVPNAPDKLGSWESQTDEFVPNDWAFISTTAERMGEPVFVDRVVGIQRPWGQFATPLDRLRFALRPRARIKRIVAHRAPGS